MSRGAVVAGALLLLSLGAVPPVAMAQRAAARVLEPSPPRLVIATRGAASAATRDTARVADDSAGKSPGIAALLGFVPGAGHWYAGEVNRGWLIAATYWTGVALSHGGRTDAVGKVGGVLVVGGLLAGIVDGAGAARRHNDRLRRQRLGR
ncbi:MAG TPA: hypothetical protein VFV33_20980 [Gemmatimonadaceae bacterium]|nr:hypothetical protein [Gemmatimonadaceae bacterium]